MSRVDILQDVTDIFYNALGDECESEQVQELITILTDYVESKCPQ